MIDINYFVKNKNGAQNHPGIPVVNGEEDSSSAPKDLRIAEAPLTVTFRGVVYPWHLDHMNHMNVQHYVGMFDQSSWVLLSMLGMDSEYFRERRSGMAALEQSISYKCELRSGEMFEIRSGVREVSERTIRVQHNMHKVSTGVLAASTTILGVHIDVEARKSSPLPPGVLNRAEAIGALVR